MISGGVGKRPENNPITQESTGLKGKRLKPRKPNVFKVAHPARGCQQIKGPL